jgi:predicted Zn-dependent peptidase
MRLVVIPMPNSETTTVVVATMAGSKNETKNINGISHFLEHMLFKGTKKRPKTKDIAEAIDRVGGEMNASTSKEGTLYYAKVDSKHWELALDVISDIYLNSKLDKAEIDRERGVIIQELNMYEDMPMYIAENVFESLLYGDQPAGWDIVGTKEIIKKLSRDDFVKYFKKN